MKYDWVADFVPEYNPTTLIRVPVAKVVVEGFALETFISVVIY